MSKRRKTLFEHVNHRSDGRRYNRREHGGQGVKGKRKLERPFSSREFIHLVLKSDKARGSLSFLRRRNSAGVEATLRRQSRKFGIDIRDFANVGNHLHLKLKASSRPMFQKFLKSVTALIARQITGARRGKPFGKFWQSLAYTRILSSAREDLILRGYFAANRREAAMGKTERERYLAAYREWMARVCEAGP